MDTKFHSTCRQEKEALQATVRALMDQSTGEGAAEQELSSKLAAAEADYVRAMDGARQTQARLASAEADNARLQDSMTVKPHPPYHFPPVISSQRPGEEFSFFMEVRARELPV